MTAYAPLMPAPARQLPVSRQALCLGAILLFGFLLRLPMLGDPAYKLDEQFYLWVGDRLLHGDLPYVNIWDRKPIGLFLIYAFARLFGGMGFVEYQLLATFAAIGTSACIFAMTRRAAGDVPGAISGMLYLLWLEVAEGGGGQSPVFYGLPVAAAAMLLLHPSDANDRRRAFGAMALIGIAIQIKYTVLFEGMFFGLVAAARALRRNGVRALPEIALLALTALVPTMLAIGVYAALGHFGDFWFANFTSIFLRGATSASDLHYRTEMALLRMVPLGTCIAASIWELRREPDKRGWQLFMLGWCAAAIYAFFSLGVLYSHYLLPVFLPLSAAAAPIFRRRPLGWVLAGLAAYIPAANLGWPEFATTARSHRQMAALTALVPADVSRGCMHMFDGPPILYYLTHACTVTRYPFPDHLSAEMEAHATGIDPLAETKRILAVRPEVITISDVDVRPPNKASFALMRDGLRRYYRLAGKAWVDERYIWVFVRR